MAADFLYSPNFLLFVAAGLALMLLLTCSMLLRQELTRPVVIVIGLSFIGVGVLGHVTILDMEMRGTKLLTENLLSASVFTDFKRYREVFAYFFPAVSAAVGTNVISDALLKHHTYQQAFSFPQFLKDIGFAVTFPFGFLVSIIALLLWAVSLPISPARRYFKSAVTRIWRWTKLKFLKHSIVARHMLRNKVYHGDQPDLREKPRRPVSSTVGAAHV